MYIKRKMAAKTNGQVKWFNNKAGYGFITVTEGEENTERDIFVHHTEIQVGQSQYKYLVQGEYVSFVLTPVEKENYQVHATQVCGINSGKLMCETRNEARSARVQSQPQQTQQSRPPRQQSQQQQRQAAPAQQQQQRQAAPQQQRQAAAPAQQQTRPPRQYQTEKNDLRRPQLDKADQEHWQVVPIRKNTSSTSATKNQPRQRQPEIELE
jgi:cold shock CspA family protein